MTNFAEACYNHEWDRDRHGYQSSRYCAPYVSIILTCGAPILVLIPFTRELVAGRPHSFPADAWSLGCLLLAMSLGPQFLVSTIPEISVPSSYTRSCRSVSLICLMSLICCHRPYNQRLWGAQSQGSSKSCVQSFFEPFYPEQFIGRNPPKGPYLQISNNAGDPTFAASTRQTPIITVANGNLSLSPVQHCSLRS